MNSHQRAEAAPALGKSDWVPVFSCTEALNKLYEVLGEVDPILLCRPI